MEHDAALGALAEQARDYARIAEAIRWLEAHRLDQPGLDDLAAALGLSPFHLQRLFTRWAGVSPKRLLGYLTLYHARRQLRAGEGSVLDVAYDAGLSGPSRLHDLTVSFQAVTPGEIRSGGAGLVIAWGVAPTPFGPAVAAFSPRGLCAFDFLDDGDPGPAVQRLRADWPAARLEADHARAAALCAQLFAGAPGVLPHLVVRGTNFQVQVWAALVRLAGPGQVLSYGALAEAAGHPGAHRAVGQALAGNRLGFLVPCHRVLRATGAFKAWRWGRERRRAVLAWEAAQVSGEAVPQPSPSTSAME